MLVSGKKHTVLVTMLNFTYSGKKATLNGAQSTEFVASTVIANLLIKNSHNSLFKYLCNIVVIMYYSRAPWNFVCYIYCTRVS